MEKEIEENKKEFPNITIYWVQPEVKERFKAWCKIHSGDRFNVGLQLLLDTVERHHTMDLFANELIELRTKIKEMEK